MGYDEKLQKRDGGNHHIPQFFDELLNDFRPLLGDEHGTYMQDVQAKAVLDSVYARLGDLTTEQKAEAIRLLLATLEGKIATAAKQDAAKAVLDTIAGKDFATQATLAAVLAKLSADPATAAKQDAAKVVLDTLATAAKQDALKTVVDVISTAVAARASEATLAAIRTALTDGSQKVTLSGSTLDVAGERTVCISRAISQSTMSSGTIFPPAQARGVVITLSAYGVTGTFAAGQGMSMYLRPTTTGVLSIAQSISTDVLTTAGSRQIIVYPGAVCNGSFTVPSRIVTVGVPLSFGINLTVGISGTFGPGEGFDREVSYQWLF